MNKNEHRPLHVKSDHSFNRLSTTPTSLYRTIDINETILLRSLRAVRSNHFVLCRLSAECRNARSQPNIRSGIAIAATSSLCFITFIHSHTCIFSFSDVIVAFRAGYRACDVAETAGCGKGGTAVMSPGFQRFVCSRVHCDRGVCAVLVYEAA